MALSSTKTGNIGIPFAASVTTSATTGQAPVTFPAGKFLVAPIVIAIAANTSGDGRDIVVTVIGAPTAAGGCVVQARKSRTLASTILSLAALQGFDVFVPVATTVYVMARAPS